jgi:molybdate/tungstate transport system permease protein
MFQAPSASETETGGGTGSGPTTATGTDTPAGGATVDWRVVTWVLGGALLLYYLVPLGALLFSQPPGRVLAQLQSEYVIVAATNSLVTASATTLLSTVFGLPLAYWLSRSTFRGKHLVLTLVIAPLVLPPIVSGMLLLELVGPGGPGSALGIPFTRSLLGIVLAQTFVASPFLVVTAKAAFDGVDRRLEHASRSLGKSRWTTVRRVTLPIAKPGIVAGITLTFARAIGEFGATIMLAYYPRTLPVQIWRSYESMGLETAMPVAVVLVVAAGVALLVINTVGANPWR